MLKIWFDVLTPKHYLMFASLERIIGRENELLLTTREYEELDRVRRRIRVRAQDNVIGRHGGAEKENKLIESTRRAYELSRLIASSRPQLAVSFGSPEAARVSFGLGIPHALVCDSPHSFFVCKLTVPLSDVVIYPWIIPASSWKQYGASKMVKYHSLDPTAWVLHREIWPEKNEVERASEGAIIIREEEYMSSYLPNSSGALEFALKLSREIPDRRFIMLRRYVRGIENYGNLMVYGGEFFGPNVLEKAAAFIGRGGTMNAEAALLGVKSFTLYPGEITCVDKYLIKVGALKKPNGISELVKLLQEDGKTRILKMRDAAQEISEILRKFYHIA